MAAETYTEEDEKRAFNEMTAADEDFERGEGSFDKAHNAWRSWTEIRALRNDAKISLLRSP